MVELLASNLSSNDSKSSLNNNISTVKVPKVKKIKIEKNKGGHDSINSNSNQILKLTTDHSKIHQDSAVPVSPDGK
jgi:hypothetical protein